MELVFFPTGGGAGLALTGEASEEGASGLRISHARQLDADPAVDAASIEATDMGNRSNTLSFSVSRTWPTPGEAADYCITHPDALPASGRLRLRPQQPGGNVVSERWLNGAAVQSAEGTFEGCATYFNYTILGGKITTS